MCFRKTEWGGCKDAATLCGAEATADGANEELTRRFVGPYLLQIGNEFFQRVHQWLHHIDR
jgi:hypothetical protein